MSARMVQRALRNNQAEAAAVTRVVSDVDLSESEADELKSAVSNPFDLLGSQDDDDTEDGSVERDPNQLIAAGLASTSDPAVTVPSKSKKKRNKGKKKNKKELGFREKPTAVENEESVDKLLERLAFGNAESSCTVYDKPCRPNAWEFSSFLTVDTKHLKAEDELRRIFGSKVINSVKRRGEAAGIQKRRLGGGAQRAGRGMPLRKSLLVVPMEHWARWDGGISMEFIRADGNVLYFRYEYSSSYQEVQKRFETCVASHDPHTIFMLLRNHPYHVDSLLASAEFYKQMGEHQRAADVLEQCLYALECAWHPWFDPALGNCRLEYSVDSNKSLFLCLFRHMQHLGRRGCHRTALEVCKLLLSLDPSDPLGALFCIDYFALRAEQYDWLDHFVNSYGTDEFTELLPNFSFSVAVACYYSKREQWNDGNRPARTGKGSVVEDNTAASTLLKQALMLHPSVLKKIVAKAPIKEDSSWAKILSHPHFDQTSEVGPTLEHLTDIYIERNYLIWRSPELQEWLKDAATMVIQAADNSVEMSNGSDIAYWKCVRSEVFDSSENKYEHLYLSEFSDSTSTLPPEEIPHLGFHLHRGFAGQNVLGEGMGLDEGSLQQAVHQAGLQGRNALLAFLQSLVPWMDHGTEAAVEDAPVLLEDGSEQADSEDDARSL